ncbi:hypothetical protein WNY37_06435 [Henriciella sp. AS95]|uniref:hypothetical protein n=1 Tax=Henriciella sp. AS95 TaxID=3135782 RepID=UPI0031770E9E
MRLIMLPALALLASACGGGDSDLPADDMAAPTPPAETSIVDESETDMPIVGGPCSYDDSVIDAHVITIEDGIVELAGTDSESFYMPVEDFPSVPEAGADYTIKAELITEGTCTPEIYTVIEGDVGGVE